MIEDKKVDDFYMRVEDAINIMTINEEKIQDVILCKNIARSLLPTYSQLMMRFEHTKDYTKLNFDELKVGHLSLQLSLTDDEITLYKAL